MFRLSGPFVVGEICDTAQGIYLPQGIILVYRVEFEKFYPSFLFKKVILFPDCKK